MIKTIAKKMPTAFFALAIASFGVAFGATAVAVALKAGAVSSGILPLLTVGSVLLAASILGAFMQKSESSDFVLEAMRELDRELAILEFDREAIREFRKNKVNADKKQVNANKKQDNTESAKNIHPSTSAKDETNKLGAMYEKGREKTTKDNQPIQIKKKQQFNKPKRK